MQPGVALAMLAVLLSPVCAIAPARAGGEPGTPKYAATVKLRVTSLRALEALWKQQPVGATYLGVHRYDDQLASYSPTARAAALRQLRDLAAQIRAISPVHLDPNDRVDRELILSNLESRRLEIEEIQPWRHDPVLYADECVNGVYYLLLRQGTPLPKRLNAALKRVQQVPRVIAEMRANVQQPATILSESAAEVFETGATFFEQSLPEAATGLTAGKRRKLQETVAASAAAMRTAAAGLRQQALAGGDEPVGMGRALYEAKLAADHFLPYDSDSLIHLGERVLREVSAELAPLSAARDRDPLWLPLPPEAAPAPESFNRSSVLAYYRTEIADVRRFVEDKGLVGVPRDIGDLVPVEVPAFMRALLPGIAMEPGAPFEMPFPGDRALGEERRRQLIQGTFYVRPVPDPLTPADRQRLYVQMLKHDFRPSVVHEGYPGHHLQLSISNRLIDPVRRAQQNNAFAEGWATYCEELMQRNGVSDEIWSRARMLEGLRFRACRVVVDARLQRRELTPARAIAFMRENAGMDSTRAAGEVARYCHQPLQAMSYLAGKEMIVALREEYRATRAARFTLRGFHDALLAVGTIPIPLARQLLLEDAPALKNGR